MKDRKKFVIGGVICFAFLCFLIVVLVSIFKKGNVDERELIPQTEQVQTKPPQSETTPENKEYLSITYTTSDLSVDTGRMMNFYTYDLGSKKLENQAQIPFESGYALGTVDLSERKIYYTKSVGRAERNIDHLFEYDMEKQTSTMLEDVHCAYNDIYLMGNRKLLVTTVPVHAIGTAVFDIGTKTFSFLYKKKMNEDGYKDFLWTTIPTPLNYNSHYGNFVNVSELEKMRYNLKVRSGKKSPKYHIDLVDADLNKKYKYTYTLKSEIGYDVSAATQIAENQVLLLVKKDLGYDSKIDYKNLFYVIDYTENSCKRVKSPFPKMLYVDNYITADDGRSYYVSGQTKDDRSGLFIYDCLQNTVEPILLDDWEREDHIVNFSLVKQ